MKVKVNHEVEQFKPRVLEITIESQKELNCIRSLFNWSPLCEFMEDYANIPTKSVRDVLDEMGGASETVLTLLQEACKRD